MQLKLFFLVLFSILITACAHHTLQAPCDMHATFCGKKTKINQW